MSIVQGLGSLKNNLISLRKGYRNAPLFTISKLKSQSEFPTSTKSDFVISNDILEL